MSVQSSRPLTVSNEMVSVKLVVVITETTIYQEPIICFGVYVHESVKRSLIKPLKQVRNIFTQHENEFVTLR